MSGCPSIVIGIINEFKGDSVGKYEIFIPGLIKGLETIRL